MEGQETLVVCCVAYNHKNYIAQALDSILSQQTNFDFRIIVHDDASTDGTTEIIRQYKKQYPERISAIYQPVNLYSQNVDITRSVLASVKSRYVAFCDGDDYWIDDTKLQRQYDALEENKDCSICFHSTKIVYDFDAQDQCRKPSFYPSSRTRFFKNKLTLSDLLKRNFISSSSIMYRWRYTDGSLTDHMPDNIAPTDYFLHLLHAQTGDILYIDRVMSVYRRHAGGIWMKKSGVADFYVQQGGKQANWYIAAEKIFNHNYQKELLNLMQNMVVSCIQLKKFDMLQRIEAAYPDLYRTSTEREIFALGHAKKRAYKKKRFHVILCLVIAFIMGYCASKLISIR